MSLRDLENIVGGAVKALHANEKFPVGVLAIRAERAAQSFPNDPTLVAISNFLTKRASTQTFISRAELKDVYNRLYTQNNQFGKLFAEELGTTGEQSKVKTASRDPLEGTSLIPAIYEKYGNAELAEIMGGFISPNKSDRKLYSSKLAKAASDTCLYELDKFATPRKIEVVAGKADLLICKATYETPKGQVSTFIPIEVMNGVPLLPTVFLSQTGFQDLSKEAMEKHIVESAGKKFEVDLEKLLTAVASVKTAAPKEMSEVDRLVHLVKAANAKNTLANGIINQVVDEEAKEFEVQNRLPEADTFASKLASVKGSAEFIFGSKIVDMARSMIKNEISNFGYRQSNIKMASYNDSTINFAVSVDQRSAFNVPVKISNKVPQLPSVIVVEGALFAFSKSGISQAIKDEVIDTRMMAVASPVYELKSSELIETVKQAMNEGNVAKAEDAINVLQNSGDAAAVKTALAIYIDGLSGKTSNVKKECTECSMQRKVAYSKHLICGHTNLPVHKVYQDKNGDCQPLYRKDIAEASTGSFMTAKILGF